MFVEESETLDYITFKLIKLRKPNTGQLEKNLILLLRFYT